MATEMEMTTPFTPIIGYGTQFTTITPDYASVPNVQKLYSYVLRNFSTDEHQLTQKQFTAITCLT